MAQQSLEKGAKRYYRLFGVLVHSVTHMVRLGRPHGILTYLLTASYQFIYSLCYRRKVGSEILEYL